MESRIRSQWRCCLTILVMMGLCSLAGCAGHHGNPRYFPYYLPPGPIQRSHAKPAGSGYYANFDHHAVRLEVRPLNPAPVPVRTQHVIIATVLDGKGEPLRQRRVHWVVQGEGHIVEVDESGYLSDRGYTIDHKSAVSYTNYGYHTITRGNEDPKDDFQLRPGQTWCVVSSASEGDCSISVVAPGIANWDKRKVVVTAKWVDAQWEFPTNATARYGTSHIFRTRVFRSTDRQPLSNYRVRYKILDGPPALFISRQRRGPNQQTTVKTDLDGYGDVEIRQDEPAQGVNRVSVEIVRPADPTKPGGVGIVLAKAIVSLEWLAPNIVMNHIGPASANIDEPVTYTTTVANTGKVESAPGFLKTQVPPGWNFIRSNPQATFDDKLGEVIWTFRSLKPGETRTFETICQPTQTGLFKSCAFVETVDKLKATKCAETEITRGQLDLKVTGPESAVVGEVATFQIQIANLGSGAAKKVSVDAEFTKGLKSADPNQGGNKVTAEYGTITPNQPLEPLPLKLIPVQPGNQAVRITLRAEGLAPITKTLSLTVRKPKLSVRIDGPPTRVVGRPAEWNITVANDGDVPLSNVVVRGQLPAGFEFEEATKNGRLVRANNEVVWELAPLRAGESRPLQLRARCGPTQKEPYRTTVKATSDYGQTAEDAANIKVVGIATLRVEAIDHSDPVEVGKEVVYEIQVENRGSAAVRNIRLDVKVSGELRILALKGPRGKGGGAGGRTASFGVLPQLDRGETKSYIVRTIADKPGNARIQVNVSSSVGNLTEEEPTAIIRSNGPQVGPPPQAPNVGKLQRPLPAGKK